MTTAALLLAAVACAALLDVLSCAWLLARERDDRPRCVMLAGAMEACGCLPVGLAITSDSVYFLAAGVVGSMVGTWLGLRRYRRRAHG